jgi:glyoxylase-like metal-dependent hydrolase (beta-lactamase superfamily II)
VEVETASSAIAASPAPATYALEMRVADRIERIHENVINVYLVEESGKLTVVDTGFPGKWPLLVAGLAGIGRTLADVDAILITHAHADHVGMAERLRRASGAPVRVHGDDLEYLLAGKSPPGSADGGFGLALVRMLAYSLRKLGFRMPPVLEATAFADGDRLDLPGRPRVVHVPGHTPGSAAFLFEDRSALCAGDSLVTLSAATGRTGPQLSPFAWDRRRARESLERLESLEARVLLPGHGEPFAGSPARPSGSPARRIVPPGEQATPVHRPNLPARWRAARQAPRTREWQAAAW